MTVVASQLTRSPIRFTTASAISQANLNHMALAQIRGPAPRANTAIRPMANTAIRAPITPARPTAPITARAAAPVRTPPARIPAPPMITRHPAPLPPAPPLQPSQTHWRAMPPRPSLKISRSGDGIVLSWRILTKDLSCYEEIASYQLYAYQENNCTPNTEMWRKVRFSLGSSREPEQTYYIQ